VRWAALTVTAVLATAAIGIAIPHALDPLIQLALAPLGSGPMMAWVRPALAAGYILFVLMGILPFLVFLAWGVARPSAAGDWRH
jgi:hypothetical protein